MELQQVRYFLAVVEARNFTRAAERCNVSQPALTKAIKKLEAELDGPLLHRDRSGPRLTTLGELVLPRLRALVRESDAVLDIASDHRRLERVPVRLGVLRTIGPVRLAEHLQRFHERAPSVELEVRVMGSRELVAGLEEASLELAITNADVEPRGWMIARPLYEEAYVVALPPGHGLAEREQVALRELAGERYIDRLACELRDRVTSVCTEKGFELYASYRSADEAWIECMVRAGVGLALLPEHSIVSSDTVRRELVDPRVQRTIALVRSADHQVSPAAKVLWDTLLAAKA